MTIVAKPTSISDDVIIDPRVFGDERGFFFESFNQKEFNQAVGQNVNFVQDNHSKSKRAVLRGLHYQLNQPQGKLVRVISGAVFDVAVDLRESSLTYGQWVGVELSEQNKRQLWIPEGFAHGFLVLSDEAEFLYKTTNYWHPESEQILLWNDSTLNIQWPNLDVLPVLNKKDACGLSWFDAVKF